jgi:hypothetical protein
MTTVRRGMANADRPYHCRILGADRAAHAAKNRLLHLARSRLNGPVLYGEAANVVKISRIRCDNGIP